MLWTYSIIVTHSVVFTKFIIFVQKRSIEKEINYRLNNEPRDNRAHNIDTINAEVMGTGSYGNKIILLGQGIDTFKCSNC
jgi:hypothetical protein